MSLLWSPTLFPQLLAGCLNGGYEEHRTCVDALHPIRGYELSECMVNYFKLIMSSKGGSKSTTTGRGVA